MLSEKKKKKKKTNAGNFMILPKIFRRKPESRSNNEKADNLRPKSEDMAGLSMLADKIH